MDPLNWWCVHVIGNITLSDLSVCRWGDKHPTKDELETLWIREPIFATAIDNHGLGWTWDICWGWIRYIHNIHTVHTHTKIYKIHFGDGCVIAAELRCLQLCEQARATLGTSATTVAKQVKRRSARTPRWESMWWSMIVAYYHQMSPVLSGDPASLYERPRACTAHTPCKGWLTLATCPLRLFSIFSASLEQKPVCTIMNQWLHSNMHSLIAWSLCLWHVFALAWLSWHVTTELVVDRWWKV